MGIWKHAEDCIAFRRLSGWDEAKTPAWHEARDLEEHLSSQWSEQVDAHGTDSPEARAAARAYALQADKNRSAFRATLGEAEDFLKVRNVAADGSFLRSIERTYRRLFGLFWPVMALVVLVTFAVPMWLLQHSTLPLWMAVPVGAAGCLVYNAAGRLIWAYRARELGAFERQLRLFEGASLKLGTGGEPKE